MMAVYFLATGITGLELLGAASFVQQLFYGGALVIAAATAELLRRASAGQGDRIE
jgi:ribose transport system permease protein